MKFGCDEEEVVERLVQACSFPSPASGSTSISVSKNLLALSTDPTPIVLNYQFYRFFTAFKNSTYNILGFQLPKVLFLYNLGVRKERENSSDVAQISKGLLDLNS